MPNKVRQKIKVLYLKDIFEQKTDEEHPMSINQIIEELAKYGVEAERKSLYRDIETLQEYGMDICSRREKHYVYYLGKRDFEEVELKLLADAVLASRFIPKRYTMHIIKKLGNLTSEYGASKLDRQLYAEKSTNDEMSVIYYNIDSIYRAIDGNWQIQFRYFDYTMKKARELRHDGAFYIISPWALVWNDGMYYLVGYDSKDKQIKHYRVDKMLKTTINEKLPRDGHQAFIDFDIDKYRRRVFGMYSGETRDVKMHCHKSLANLIIDRFGRKDVVMYPVDEEHFDVHVKVAVSPVFISWAMGLSDKLEIVSPESVREEIREMARKLTEVYEK